MTIISDSIGEASTQVEKRVRWEPTCLQYSVLHIDDMTEEEYTAKHGARLEDEAIRKADVAFVTSHNLHRLKSHLNPNTHILHNAVDITIFEKALEEKLPRPKELEGVTGKIIGRVWMDNTEK